MARLLLTGFGLLVLVSGVAALLDLPSQKPRLPIRLDTQTLEVTNTNADDLSHSLLPGDRIKGINRQPVENLFHLNFCLDGLRVGQVVELSIERNGNPTLARAKLIRSLDTALLVINFLVAVLVWSFGMLVLYKTTLVINSLLFYSMTMSLSAVMFVYWPENPLGFSFPWVSLFVNNGLYPLTVAFLVHFSFIYPEGWHRDWMRFLTPAIYLPALFNAVLLVTFLPDARANLSWQVVSDYQILFERVLPIQLAMYFIVGLLVLAWSYLHATKETTRSRLKWLFWGFAVGISPHVLLNELPKAFGVQPILSEHITYLLTSAAPLAFFVSVVRHQMLDINMVIRRSVAYSLLTIAVVLVYLGLVSVGDYLAVSLWGKTMLWIRIVVVLMLAIAFEPARVRVASMVDRVFYRSQYDQRLSLMKFSRSLAHILDLNQLSKALHELIDEIIPVESISVLVAQGDSLKEVPIDKNKAGPLIDLAISDIPGLHKMADSEAMTPTDLPEQLTSAEFLVPLHTEERLAGLIALGAKRSGDDFQTDDIHLVKALAAQVAISFDRARAFQMIHDLNASLEQKIWKRTEQLAQANDRLADQYNQLNKLNEMKEALTRMVVHDLKNPVSTILLGLEFLNRSSLDNIPDSVTNTLNIISSTAFEIQDLIANLLDVYRMEAGEINLTRRPTPLPELLQEGASRVKVQAQYRHVTVEVDAPDIKPDIDSDLMSRVLVNLLTNAIKHSSRNGKVELHASIEKNDPTHQILQIQVTNQGVVIPKEFHAKVFEKFFQVEGKKSGVIAGTGLGLTFCKLVIEAHQGKIWVESPPPGRPDGSRVTMQLQTDLDLEQDRVIPSLEVSGQ